MLGERTIPFGVVAGRGLGRVATALIRLPNSLGMKNFHLHPVSHWLTDDLQRVKVAKCGELLCALEAMQRTHFHYIITSDES
jgi:hypothetical protein